MWAWQSGSSGSFTNGFFSAQTFWEKTRVPAQIEICKLTCCSTCLSTHTHTQVKKEASDILLSELPQNRHKCVHCHPRSRVKPQIRALISAHSAPPGCLLPKTSPWYNAAAPLSPAPQQTRIKRCGRDTLDAFSLEKKEVLIFMYLWTGSLHSAVLASCWFSWLHLLVIARKFL